MGTQTSPHSSLISQRILIRDISNIIHCIKNTQLQKEYKKLGPYKESLDLPFALHQIDRRSTLFQTEGQKLQSQKKLPHKD